MYICPTFCLNVAYMWFYDFKQVKFQDRISQIQITTAYTRIPFDLGIVELT